MADQANFPDIYIDGSSAGDGSLASPYSDFSDINWSASGDNSITDYYAGAEAASVTINLKKGVEWREQMTVGASGSATYPIIIGAYGTGADPVILGSEELITWSADTGHWTCAYVGVIPVLWFVETGGSVNWGNLKANKAACVAEYDWYSDGSDVWVFAATDPDTRYTSVEAPIRSYGIDGFNGKDYVTIDGIEIRYALDSGIRVAICDDWIVENCTVCYFCKTVKNGENSQGIFVNASSNATIRNNIVHDCASQGIWVFAGAGDGDSNNSLVEGNEVYNCYHSNIDYICGNNGEVNGGIVRYNICYQDENYDTSIVDGALFFIGQGQDGDDLLENIDVYYNIGYSVSKMGFQVTGYCSNINFYNNVLYGDLPGTTPLRGFSVDGASGTCSVTIKNNICMDVSGGCVFVLFGNNITACDYNCWYHSGGGANLYGVYEGGEYHFDDFDANNDWQGDTGYDTNGLWEDPKLIDPANDDFTLQVGSPCINAGTDVSLTTDYAGNIVGALPDIGAYELIGAISTIPPMMGGDYYLALG